MRIRQTETEAKERKDIEMSFFVTAIAYYPEDTEKKYDKPYKRTSTFGHWPNFEGAQRAVSINEGGMDECLYNYLVIEEVAYGVYGRIQLMDPDNPAKGEWWYEWQHPDGQEGHWVPMTKPEWSFGMVSWA